MILLVLLGLGECLGRAGGPGHTLSRTRAAIRAPNGCPRGPRSEPDASVPASRPGRNTSGSGGPPSRPSKTSRTSGPWSSLGRWGVSWLSLAENCLVWRVLLGVVFSFRRIWGNWRVGRGKVLFRNFCARFLRVGGAFSFQTGAWRAQIRNRCVGG